MPLELNGERRKALRGALTDAFPSWKALQKMLDAQVNMNLAVVTSEARALDDNAFDLIGWAHAQGQLAELIVAARNENPGNTKLEHFAASVGLSSAAVVPLASLEKVFSGNNTFLDPARWRTAMVQSEWRVCRVDQYGRGRGTGFLVGQDLILTNYHVVEALLAAPSDRTSWSCRFDHKLSETGSVISMGRVVTFATDWNVDAAPYSKIDVQPDPKSGDPTDDQLDFALIRLADSVGNQSVGKSDEAEARGWFVLPTAAVDYAKKRVIAILQHPLAQPMKLALGMDQDIKVNSASNRIRYTVPTDSGSSGSPVFDADWNVIALHHSGDPNVVKPEYNEGIPIAKIASRSKVSAAVPR